MMHSLRARLTVWYVSIFGAVLIAVCLAIYALLGRALYSRVDENLVAVTRIAITSLSNDLAEGQSPADAAKSTASELASDQAVLAIYNERGDLLAAEGHDEDLEIRLPAMDSIPDDEPLLFTVAESDDADDRHRMAALRARLPAHATTFLILASSDLERTDDELASLRQILLFVVPAALVLAGFVGWFLARRSLSPVRHMASRARRIGVGNLGERLPVSNPGDELGQLAGTFNELLDRLGASFAQQRQFMADASHELRTPVATMRTAAGVALQQPRRSEEEYREALQVIEGQSARLTRVVEDMFTLARADSGNYPVRRAPLYLDEMVHDAVRAARVLAAERRVSIEAAVAADLPFTGDEDLLRRMVGNLLDNALRYAPPDSVVRVTLQPDRDALVIAVSDAGPGVPADARPQIFERFYRGDPARTRSGLEAGGAGLGLAIVRWIARQHGGDVALDESTPPATTFRIVLPRGAPHS